VVVDGLRRYTLSMVPGVPSFDQLSTDDRIRLVQDLWDEIAARPEDVDVRDAQRAELDRRMEDHRASPDDAIEWATVKARILGR
jgi:putative addiction module component (TIGR02574 family)